MSALPSSEHPRHQLSDILGHPVRFSLAAALAQTEEVDFATLRNHLQVSDSVLSKQATALESAGYVKIRKGHIGKRPRTWLKLTKEGEQVWQNHLAALQEIAFPQGSGREDKPLPRTRHLPDGEGT